MIIFLKLHIQNIADASDHRIMITSPTTTTTTYHYLCDGSLQDYYIYILNHRDNDDGGIYVHSRTATAAVGVLKP